MLFHSFTITVRSRTEQKTKFSIKDFFGKCDQSRNFLRILSYLLKKPSMENFISCELNVSISLSDFEEIFKSGFRLKKQFCF